MIRLMVFLLCVSTTLSAVSWGTHRANEKGIDHAKNQHTEDALEHFSNALSSAKHVQPGILRNIGHVYYENQEWEKATQAYGQSEQLKQDADSYLYLGNTAFKQGLYDQAKTLYMKSLLEEPDHKEAKLNLELTMQKIQKREDASKETDQQKKKDSSDGKKNQDQDKNQDKNQQENESGQSSDMNDDQKELDDLRKQQEQERQARNMQTDMVLKAMDQQEKAARKRYFEKQTKESHTDYDW